MTGQTGHKPGDEVSYTVTYLEMDSRPSYGWPPTPAGMTGALLRAERPPVWYFRALYDAVGAITPGPTCMSARRPRSATGSPTPMSGFIR